MKPRRVVITLEAETDIPLKEIKHLDEWAWFRSIKALQVQANIIKKEKL